MKTLARLTDTFHELFAIYFGTVGLAALVFSLAEHKPFMDSLWWAFVTAMTVGYGDMYPVTLIGRIDGVMLMHIVPLLVIPLVVARILMTVIEDRNQFTHEEQVQLFKDIAEIKTILQK